MKQKISANNKLDSGSFGSRAKELISISIFTIIAALVSTVLIDIIVFPLTMFAVSDIPSYNTLIKLSITVILTGLVLFFILSSTIRLRREGCSTGYIVAYMIIKPLYYIGLFLFILLLCAILIAIIYLLFSLNYYYLHRIAGGA